MAGAKSTSAIDLERALLDPSAAFGTPEDVLADAALTSGQKIEILRRWEYDAAEVSVAVEEGMPGADNGLLRRILLALDALTGGYDADRTGPTKQHGLENSAVTQRK